MRTALLVFALASLTLAACTHSSGSGGDAPPQTSAERAASPPADESVAPARAIAAIVTNDTKVTIVGGGSKGELRVVVRKLDGALVADGLTLDQLRTTDPTLHAIVTNAFAMGGTGTTYVDATLDHHHSTHAGHAIHAD